MCCWHFDSHLNLKLLKFIKFVEYCLGTGSLTFNRWWAGFSSHTKPHNTFSYYPILHHNILNHIILHYNIPYHTKSSHTTRNHANLPIFILHIHNHIVSYNLILIHTISQSHAIQYHILLSHTS